MSGAAAFAGTWNHRRTVPQYAWVPQLFAGRTVRRTRLLRPRARREALAAPLGSTRTLGTHTLPAYVRYYDQQRDLIRTLQRAGFDVYVVSAGAEPVTEVWSRGVGVDAAHTIAIRSVLDRRGRITTGTRAAATYPATGARRSRTSTASAAGSTRRSTASTAPPPGGNRTGAHRTALAAGDADTDVTFVGDATGAHLVLNRNKPEIMCRAYDDADGRWVINPMFIEPLPRRAEPYPCATSAYNAPDGGRGPVRREDGSVVPDQKDTVYGTEPVTVTDVREWGDRPGAA